MKKFWNLVILVLAATLSWQLYQGGKLSNIRQDLISLMMPTNRRLGPEATTTVVPAGTPVFAEQSESAAPEPEASATPFFASASESNTSSSVASASVQEASTPVAIPTPTPKVEEVDLASIDRRYWPKMVKLNKEMQFSIVAPNGSVTGLVAAPSGVLVRLVDLRGAKLVVTLATGSAPQPVEMADTDIQERLREIIKVVGSAGSIGASSSVGSSMGSSAGTGHVPAANPASTPWVPKLGDRDRTPFNRR